MLVLRPLVVAVAIAADSKAKGQKTQSTRRNKQEITFITTFQNHGQKHVSCGAPARVVVDVVKRVISVLLEYGWRMGGRSVNATACQIKRLKTRFFERKILPKALSKHFSPKTYSQNESLTADLDQQADSA